MLVVPAMAGIQSLGLVSSDPTLTGEHCRLLFSQRVLVSRVVVNGGHGPSCVLCVRHVCNIFVSKNLCCDFVVCRNHLRKGSLLIDRLQVKRYILGSQDE